MSNPSRRVALLYCVPVLRVGIQVLLPAQEHAGERDRLTLLLGLRVVKASYRDNETHSKQITTFLGHFQIKFVGKFSLGANIVMKADQYETH